MVAEIHSGATLSPGKLELLTPWVATQRWFQAKGREPHLRKVKESLNASRYPADEEPS